MMRYLKRYSIFLSLIFLFLSAGCHHELTLVRGEGFSIRFPDGWTKVKRDIEPAFQMESKFSPQTVIFVSPQVNPVTNVPEAMIAMHVVRPNKPFWLEDDFPILVDVLGRSGYAILDQGQIKLDEEIADWVVYRDDYQERVRLEFFTVNGSGMVFRLQYSAAQDKFGVYRKDFEDTKATIKIRKW